MRSFRFYPVAIPDEIIKEILSPVLEIPDKAFVHPSLHSGPFASYKLTSSTVLEVCKAWLRVATPLLYETVVLRSKAQAQALARALQGNPDLGRFVKKARIEGGYGDDILEIFKRCPALKDLWISAALWSNESVAGYAKAFHYINPQKLIVFDNPMQEKDSKIKKAVYSRLGEAALSDWTDLSVVIMDIHTALLNRAAPLISGILRGKSKIELLGLIGSRAKASGMVLDLLTMPTLKEIRRLSWWTKKPAFEDIAITRRNALEYCMRQDRLFYEKVLYVQDLSEGTSQPAFETAPVASTVNPNWRPLSLCGASEAERSKILTLIIHNAMSPLELGTAEILTSTGNTTLQLFRAGLMQVSREFRDLAKAGLYEAPVIKPRGIRTLAASPFVGLVRYLWLLDESRIASEDLVHLITCANNLVLISFVGTPHREAFSHGPPNVAPYIWSNFRHHFCIPTTSIVKLSLHSAGTLQHLHLGVESSRKRITKGEVSTFMEAFSQLHQLRSLVLTSGPSARPPLNNRNLIPISLPSTTLPHLERLVVNMNSAMNISLIAAMARVKLPALCWLNMTCGTDLQDAALPFMQRHGEKLQYFQSNPLLMSLFSHCPNVTRWDCDNYLPLGVHDAWNFNMLTPGVQYALRTIVVTWHSFCPEDLVDLLDTDLSCLPHLATIHVRGLSWPTCERDIEKSPWITPVETLSKERGITVTNGQGRGWVPRLKPETNKEKRRR